MKTIYKYTIDVEDVQDVEMPEGAKILCVQTQYETPWIWAMVDNEEAKTLRRVIRIYGTGHPIAVSEERLQYLGTFQLLGGKFVGHVFEQIA